MKIEDLKKNDFLDKFLHKIEHHMIMFYAGLFDVFDTYNVTFNIGNIPHPVHLREGMEIRNTIKDLADGTLDEVNLDDVYGEVMECAVKRYKELIQ